MEEFDYDHILIRFPLALDVQNLIETDQRNNEVLKVSGGSTQFIVIKLGDEQYGIDIKYIENIVRMQHITRVPKVDSYLKGVIISS